MNTFKSDLWVLTKDRLPIIEDASVLVEFPNGSVEMVHIEDNFVPVTAGCDASGNQLYTYMYIEKGIQTWHPMPLRANHEPNP